MIGKGEPFKEVALEELHGLSGSTGGHRLAERPCIAPEMVRGNRDPVHPFGDDGVLAQRAPQIIEGLAEGVPGILGIQLGPEDLDQAISRTGLARKGRQVGKKRDALRLTQHGTDRRSRSSDKLDPSEGSKPVHGHLNIGLSDRDVQAFPGSRLPRVIPR
jgi:hypothetical protein